MIVKDFLGREIRKGNIIVFPGRRGSSMWLSQATVWEVYDNGQLSVQVPGSQGFSTITRTDRCVVVQ